MGKKTMTAFENWQVVLGSVQAGLLLMTFLGAYYIGRKQNEINERLRDLQDYVAVSVVPGRDGKIVAINTGKTNLYLWGFDMPGNPQRLERPRLIPAGTMEAAYYWIDPPNLSDTVAKTRFDFKLYLTDEFENKWISEHGGEAEPEPLKLNSGTQMGFKIIVWSYKTYKSDWILN